MFVTTGKNVANAMQTILSLSSKPSTKINGGTIAVTGIGRSNSIAGSSVNRTGRESAIATPTTMPAKLPSAYPRSIRPMLDPMTPSSSPFTMPR